MRRLIAVIVLLIVVGTVFAKPTANFVFFSQEREKIHSADFLNCNGLTGAQITYPWRLLEPQRDSYDFSPIREDLEFLRAHHKRLFIQLQDATFVPTHVCVPKYLVDDPQFHGGVGRSYSIEADDDSRATPEGWVARRWDPTVRKRFQKLLAALGKAFDGKIEGINLAETSVNFGASGRLYPKDFTPAKYRDAIVDDMAALKRAFPKSITIQYANFMPGEWLPNDDKGYLKSVYRAAARLQVGVGGPDLLPNRPGQMQHAYPLIRSVHGKVVTGIAVQDGNYGSVNPKTGKSYPVAELLGFAEHYLGVDYVFWCTEEPYFSKQVLPFFKRFRTGHIGNT